MDLHIELCIHLQHVSRKLNFLPYYLLLCPSPFFRKHQNHIRKGRRNPVSIIIQELKSLIIKSLLARATVVLKDSYNYIKVYKCTLASKLITSFISTSGSPE